MALNEYGLTELQEKFCEEYTADPKGNATAAYIRAGYGSASASVEAHKALRNPKIISRIKDLRNEALRASGYDKEKVREAILRRMVGIVTTSITDVVHISPSKDDENREAILQEIAEANGGQQVLDFGDLLLLPTPHMSEEAKGSIKSLHICQATKESDGSIDVDMHDPIAAAKLLAEITGLKSSDGSVTFNLAEEINKSRERSGLTDES